MPGTSKNLTIIQKGALIVLRGEKGRLFVVAVVKTGELMNMMERRSDLIRELNRIGELCFFVCV